MNDLPALADSLTACGLTRTPPLVLITRWQVSRRLSSPAGSRL